MLITSGGSRINLLKNKLADWFKKINKWHLPLSYFDNKLIEGLILKEMW